MAPRAAGLLAGLCGALALALVPGCGDSAVASGSSGGGPSASSPAADDPVEFGPLPDFELVDQLGRSVTRDSLRGRPLVLAAIYSRCVGPCPAISRGMQELQDELKDTDTLLVSISVDPEHDDPAVLASYAEGYGADPERWLLLSGSEEEIYRLVREGLKMAVQRDDETDIGQAVTHSNRLAAVDAEGRLRGWYLGTDAAQRARLRRRMQALAHED